MKSFTYLVGLLSVISSILKVQAAPRSAGLTVLESLPKIPQGWFQDEAVPASKRLRFRIAVKQQNAFAFEQHVMDVSTPGHPLYGNHLSREQLKDMLRPSSDATESILGWLEAEGVPATDIENDGDWINFYVPATEAERILDTKYDFNLHDWHFSPCGNLMLIALSRFYYYTSAVNEVRRIRTLHYSVPQNIAHYIQMIQPTTRFGRMKAERSFAFYDGEGQEISKVESLYKEQAASLELNATFCNTTITPTCLRQLYNVGNFRADPNNGKFTPFRTPPCDADTLQATKSVSAVISKSMLNSATLNSS